MITDSLDGGVTYLIIGGTGGIGRSIAKRMIQRGARHIVLLSRSGKVTKELNQLVQDSRLLGASIYIIKRCDVANAARVKSLIAELEMTLPPIRGVIHAAMVLRVCLFSSSLPSFHRTFLLTYSIGCFVREDDVPRVRRSY